jgi:hypothetical protein
LYNPIALVCFPIKRFFILFRLPKAVEADLAAPVFDGQAPEPVMDTEEVAAAKAEFQKAFEEVQSREKRESDPQVSIL